MPQKCLTTPSSVAVGDVKVKSFGVVTLIVVMFRFLQNTRDSSKLCYNVKIAFNHVKFADVKIYHVVD